MRTQQPQISPMIEVKACSAPQPCQLRLRFSVGRQWQKQTRQCIDSWLDSKTSPILLVGCCDFQSQRTWKLRS